MIPTSLNDAHINKHVILALMNSLHPGALLHAYSFPVREMFC